MVSRRYLLFFVGIIIGYLLTGFNIYSYQKKYSTMDETRIIETDNYSLKALVESPKIHGTYHYTFPAPDLPYYITFSIENKINEVQWIDAPKEYLIIDLCKDSEKISNIFTIDDTESEPTRIFLAPKGKCEVTTIWQGKRNQSDQTFLPDGRYEIVLRVFLNGDKYVLDGIYFAVKTMKVRH